MRDVTELRLIGTLDPILLHRAASRFAKISGDSLKLRLDAAGYSEIHAFPPIADAVATATLIAVIVKSVLATQVWVQKKQWTEVKVRNTIEQALIKEGVKEYEIQEITNLNSLCQGRIETRPLGRRKTRPDESAGDGD